MPAQPRALWASNRLCEAVTVHRNQQKHRQNVYNIKPMIDNRDPRRPRTANSKGARLEAERNAQIMHETTILLNKLSRILTRDAEPPRASLRVSGLNDPQRKIEREKIDRDNLMLLRRLQNVRASIDVEQQLQQHREHANMLAMSRNFAANPFLLNGDLAAGSGIAAARRRPQSASAARAPLEEPEELAPTPAVIEDRWTGLPLVQEGDEGLDSEVKS